MANALWVKGNALEACNGAVWVDPQPDNCVCGQVETTCCDATLELPGPGGTNISGLHNGFIPGDELSAYTPVDLTDEPPEFSQAGVVIAGSLSYDFVLDPERRQATVDYSGDFPSSYGGPFGSLPPTGAVQQEFSCLATCGVFAPRVTPSVSGLFSTLNAGIGRQYDEVLGEWTRTLIFVITTPGSSSNDHGFSVRARWSMLDEVWRSPVVASNGLQDGISADLSLTHLTNYLRIELSGTLCRLPSNGFGGPLVMSASALRVNFHKRWIDWCGEPMFWTGLAP